MLRRSAQGLAKLVNGYGGVSMLLMYQFTMQGELVLTKEMQGLRPLLGASASGATGHALKTGAVSYHRKVATLRAGITFIPLNAGFIGLLTH